MASPANKLAFSVEVAKEAAARWRSRHAERVQKTESVSEGQIDQADSKVRLAKRANRLLDHMRERLEPVAAAMPKEVRDLIEHAPVGPGDVDNAFMERDRRNAGFSINRVSRSRPIRRAHGVGRIATDLGGGRKSFGTGFLVTPRLLMTNHHVLESDQEAGASVVEFDSQLDRTGQPLAIERFALDPNSFFLNDKQLDFALVAVSERSERGKQLSDYGYCPLIGSEGKITVGEPINIIQHPRAEMKQIVIRENKLLDVLDTFLHYEADTDPGSSGSPVFNDQWEVAALHHSGIPKTDAAGNLLNVDGGIWRDGDDPERLAWASNEGIRVSKLVAFITQAQLPAAMTRRSR